jgi:hypothetical protein
MRLTRKGGAGTTRRRLLGGLAAAVVSGLGLGVAWRYLRGGGSPGRRREEELLGALLDILIPDGEVPGHRATGILEAVLEDFRSNAQTHKALLDGMELLDEAARRQGGAGFLALDHVGRVRVVEELARSEQGTPGWLFYGFLRERAMLRHYADPMAWSALGFHHPPQPRGYYDYREPPSLGS